MQVINKSRIKKFLSSNLKFFIFIIVVLTIQIYTHPSFSSTPGTIDSAYKYAYSENTGWINFGDAQGSVQVSDTELSGYAYGENIGWISLNCSNDNSCSTHDYKIINDGEGNLSGYAYGENIGWIDFNPANSGVIINPAGEFTGYAYGENIGWISFNCANDSSCATSDYKVKTTWLPQSIRPVCNNGIDDDGDGKTDHPTDGGCASLTDTDEVDGGSSFISPVKPNVQNVVVTLNGLELSLDNLPANITQIAISRTPDFSNESWRDFDRQKFVTINNTKETLYVKFKTKEGAVSDVITYKPQAIVSNLSDGDIVKTIDSPDVYIIKLKNNKRYKRLILSPQVFDSYQHLKWANIKIISQAELDLYATSSLVKETNDSTIYELMPSGDTGTKRTINTSQSYDADSIYEINAVDRDNYISVN